MKATMQHVAPETLEDLPSRITYLSSFLELTAADSQALTSAAPLIAPLVPTILDAVYTKLLTFDITAQAFVPSNTDYTGPTVTSVQDLTLSHPQIKLRQDFLKGYLVKLVSTSDLSPTSPFWKYLDNVGIMHTGYPGFKHREARPDLRVEYMHMGALLGYVIGLVVDAVLDMDEVPNAEKKKVLLALNKVLWIQNDLFVRHYVTKPVSEFGRGKEEEKKPEAQEGLIGGLLKKLF